MVEDPRVLSAPGTQWQVGSVSIAAETRLIPLTVPGSISVGVQTPSANTQTVFIKKAGGSNLWEMPPGSTFYIDLDHQADPIYVEPNSGTQSVVWLVLIP